jgi:hypothetical protein
VGGEPDDEADAVEARYQARLAAIEAEYQQNLEEYEKTWNTPGGLTRHGFLYVPYGPNKSKELRDKQLREARDEFLRDVDALEARRRLSEVRRTEEPDDQDEQPNTELDLGGDGYTDEEIVTALGLLVEGRLTARGLEKAAGMSFRRARRLWSWFDSGALGWDGRQFVARPDLRWIKRETPKGPRWTLIRSE